MGRWGIRLIVVALAMAMAAGVALFLRTSAPPADGPEPVAWDREACAHCRMSVGDPAFAVQARLADGKVVNFDDPGCYFRYVHDEKADVRATWFHAHGEDRWLPPAGTAFVRVPTTPMGYGWAAVPAGSPDAVGLEDARARVLERAPPSGASP